MLIPFNALMAVFVVLNQVLNVSDVVSGVIGVGIC
jgi:hypothetical protein